MEQAVRARAAAKGWLTRASAEIEWLLSEAEADPVSVTESALVDCMEQFSKRLSAYDEAQGAVELVIDMKDLDSDISESADYRISKRKAYIRAGQLLSKLTSNVETSGGGGSNKSRSCGVGDTYQARLPKLELPKFSGDHTQWQPFWDKFQAVVDKSDLAFVTKFTYLQSLLKGEAAAAISGLSLTESNYSIACDILIKRFGRKERIVFGHIQELLNLDSTGKAVESLWALYDELQSYISSLESLGVTGNAYGVILTPMVLHRLPENVRLEWARVGEGKESDLEGLLQFLFMEIQRRERSRTFQTQVRDRE
ncbi:hypothetical protein ElyMa_002248700 [Elysia marginata]|uniref:Uncharacterized protein n=1 Tax=Elysia marginata TaxID=1093978 RepID=A0AAV4FY30_9GAST|nr:hypothetical protein ElyMa_002248700 [Elysia marginata]